MQARLIGTLATLLTVTALASPSPAQAYCPLGDDGVSYNRAGQGAKFKRLNPMQGMNCASARYVMNKWLRRSFERSYRAKLPTRFYDGYVTWYCGRTSYRRWRCDEYDSNTAFRFVAYLI